MSRPSFCASLRALFSFLIASGWSSTSSKPITSASKPACVLKLRHLLFGGEDADGRRCHFLVGDEDRAVLFENAPRNRIGRRTNVVDFDFPFFEGLREGFVKRSWFFEVFRFGVEFEVIGCVDMFSGTASPRLRKIDRLSGESGLAVYDYSTGTQATLQSAEDDSGGRLRRSTGAELC